MVARGASDGRFDLFVLGKADLSLRFALADLSRGTDVFARGILSLVIIAVPLCNGRDSEGGRDTGTVNGLSESSSMSSATLARACFLVVLAAGAVLGLTVWYWQPLLCFHINR